ncbi:methylmalonyl-CoA mutase cobalamin-binding subunit [Microbacterium resistens]|uniref:Methylmalonyl-CoA mutase cobalamin-binding subunit n=1 Tax=Microbacterium resistens TaxID=156977 RepID=A0ABU1SFR6_9MICO|nr:aspartate/glutamate racemase family protein [Microbacterium resistens]MDR6868143.1 methylmalonyl-CoA mutase cobalamin-binding subunit [Microbacterium resistens]
MTTPPKIALISAVTAAMAPARSALGELYPEAEVWNILDDRLLSDADARGGLDDALRARMTRLIDHALAEGADGVLLTCSLYGPVATDAQRDVPVLAPDEAAFREIADARYDSVLVVASFDGAKDDSVERLKATLREAGVNTVVTAIAVPAAMAATKAQDPQALLTALAEAVTPFAAQVDAVFLAQYSLAPAARGLAEAVGVPVLSGPASSAIALRERLAAGSGR